jgi:hypothetical protein
MDGVNWVGGRGRRGIGGSFAIGSGEFGEVWGRGMRGLGCGDVASPVRAYAGRESLFGGGGWG